MQEVMKEQGLDVLRFEFVRDLNGQPYFYDINTNTNYNSDAEQRAGVSAMKSLAHYLKTTLDNQSAGSMPLQVKCYIKG